MEEDPTDDTGTIDDEEAPDDTAQGVDDGDVDAPVDLEDDEPVSAIDDEIDGIDAPPELERNLEPSVGGAGCNGTGSTSAIPLMTLLSLLPIVAAFAGRHRGRK